MSIQSMEKVTVKLTKRDQVIARREAKKRLQSFKKDPDWDTDKKSYGTPAEARE